MDLGTIGSLADYRPNKSFPEKPMERVSKAIAAKARWTGCGFRRRGQARDELGPVGFNGNGLERGLKS